MYYIMPRHTYRKPKGRIRGRGLWDWVKKGYNFIKNKAIPYVRQNKLISRGLSLIPHPYAQTGSTVASTLGFGRRRIRYR